MKRSRDEILKEVEDALPIGKIQKYKNEEFEADVEGCRTYFNEQVQSNLTLIGRHEERFNKALDNIQAKPGMDDDDVKSEIKSFKGKLAEIKELLTSYTNSEAERGRKQEPLGQEALEAIYTQQVLLAEEFQKFHDAKTKLMDVLDDNLPYRKHRKGMWDKRPSEKAKAIKAEPEKLKKLVKLAESVLKDYKKNVSKAHSKTGVAKAQEVMQILKSQPDVPSFLEALNQYAQFSDTSMADKSFKGMLAKEVNQKVFMGTSRSPIRADIRIKGGKQKSSTPRGAKKSYYESNLKEYLKREYPDHEVTHDLTGDKGKAAK